MIEKWLKFLTSFSTALFFLALLTIILQQNFILNVDLGLRVSLIHFLGLATAAGLLNLLFYSRKNEIKFSQLPKVFQSKLNLLIERIKNAVDNYWQKLRPFYNLPGVKWGVIPGLMFLAGLGLFISSVPWKEQPLTVLEYEHEQQLAAADNKVYFEFRAEANNLGIVALPFEVEELEKAETDLADEAWLEEENEVLDEEQNDAEAADESELLEKESEEKDTTPDSVEEELALENDDDSEGELDSQVEAESDVEPEPEVKPATAIFRIKEKGADEWHTEYERNIALFKGHEYFPFGFEKIADSQGKEFVVEIESEVLAGVVDQEGEIIRIVNEDIDQLNNERLDSDEGVFEKVNEASSDSEGRQEQTVVDKKLYVKQLASTFKTKHQYSRAEIMGDVGSLVGFAQKKASTFLAEFWLAAILIVGLMPGYYVASRVWYEKTRPDEDYINFFSKNLFLISLFLVAIGSFSFDIFDIERSFVDTFNIIGRAFLYLAFLAGLIICLKNFPYIKNSIQHQPFLTDKKQVNNALHVLTALLVFIAARIFFIFSYSGNYPDIFYHLISGIKFWETGQFPFIYTSAPYTRGKGMSILAGLFIKIFGRNINLIQLAPLTIGIINFFLLFYLAAKILKNKLVIFCLLLTYSLSAWTIFNHIYIRFFVLVEFFLLISIILLQKILDTVKRQRWNSTLIWTMLLVINISLSNYLIADRSSYLILVASALGSVYIIYKLLSRYQAEILAFVLSNKIYIFGFLIFIILAFIPFSKNISTYFIKRFNFLFHASTNTSSNHIDFYQLFFKYYLATTVLAVIAILLRIFNILGKDDDRTLIIFIGSSLLLIHAISSRSLQIIRGMMYIFPIYFIIAFIFFEKSLNLFDKKARKITFLLTMLLFISNTLIRNIKVMIAGSALRIPGEIAYHEYTKAYSTMRTWRQDGYKIVNAVSFVQIGEFFNLNPDYNINLTSEVANENKRRYYYDESTNRYLATISSVELVTDENKFEQLVNDHKACIVLKPHSKKYFLKEDGFQIVINNLELKDQFIGYDFYCN